MSNEDFRSREFYVDIGRVTGLLSLGTQEKKNIWVCRTTKSEVLYRS